MRNLVLFLIIINFSKLIHSQITLTNQPNFEAILAPYKLEKIFSNSALDSVSFVVTALTGSPKKHVIYHIYKDQDGKYSSIPLDINYLEVQKHLYGRWVKIKGVLYLIETSFKDVKKEYNLSLRPIENNKLSKNVKSLLTINYTEQTLPFSDLLVNNNSIHVLIKYEDQKNHYNIKAIDYFKYSSDKWELLKTHKIYFDENVRVSNLNLSFQISSLTITYVEKKKDENVFVVNSISDSIITVKSKLENSYKSIAVNEFNEKLGLIGAKVIGNELIIENGEIASALDTIFWKDKIRIDISSFLSWASTDYYIGEETFQLNKETQYLVYHLSCVKATGQSNGGNFTSALVFKDLIVCKLVDDHIVWANLIQRGSRYDHHEFINELTLQDGQLILVDYDRKELYDSEGNYDNLSKENKFSTNFLKCQYILDDNSGNTLGRTLFR